MNGRLIVLGAILVLASACGSPNAATPAAATTARAAAAAPTMSPADMAAMGHATATPATQPAAAAQPATAAQPAAAPAPAVTSAPAPAINVGTSGPTAAPAPTSAPTPTAAPVATTAPTPTAAPAGPATTVTVTLVDTAVRLSTASVPAGTVTFVVTNAGTTTHELVVLQTTIAQNALPPDPANPGTVLEPGFLGKVASLAPHATGSLTLTLGAGSYVLICNEPVHYSALGMHTAFSVR